MNPALHRPLDPAAMTRRPVIAAISLTILMAVAATVLFIAVRSPLKDDIAWLLYVARRWLAGRELYVDVVEVNPPLIVWISAIPLQMARWFGVPSQFVAMPLFVAVVLGCSWWTACLLRPRGGIFADNLPVFAVIGSALLILPAADLGQREHLLVAAFLPYLALFAGFLDTREARRHATAEQDTTLHAPPRPIIAWVSAGVLAGLGCALKPRYAAAFAALEGLALLRGARPWRIMPLTAATTLAVYAGVVAAVCPAYLRRAVPMALALYGATDVPFLALLADSTLLICGQGVAVALLWLRRRTLTDRSLMLTLVMFAASCTIVCFVDGKNWYYHRLPAIVATVLALLLWTVTELVQNRWRIRWPALTGALAVTVFCASSIARLEPEAVEAIEPTKSTVDRLEQIIHAQHARTYIAFSEWIALGFPVVNETGVAWASRFDSMWALKGEVWRARFDPAVAREWPIARWVAHDFIVGCPDIAVVDTRETTNYIRVLSQADPAFGRAWTRYRPVASFDGLVVYRRSASGCADVWVATEVEAGPRAR